MIPTRRILLLLLLSRPARADALDPATLMARLAGVAERRATFREERTLAALTAPLVSTGRLRYRRPDYLEKETLWPQPERMVIDGNRLIVSDPVSNDPPHVIPLDAQPGLRPLVDGMRAPLAGDLALLRRSFSLSASGTLAAWRLDLAPADPDAASLLTAIRLAGRGDWIDAIDTVQANGDTVSLRIAQA